MLTNEGSLSAEEKIKQLIEFEKDKRKELEEKKKELDEKKKELDQLETKRKKEIEAARKEIEDKIEELATEEKKRFEELEEIHRRREAESASLESTIEEEDKKGRIREAPRQRGYGEAVDEILRGNPSVYDITNYNVMNQLERIAREVKDRPIDVWERNFVDLVQYHAQKMQQNDFYREKDTNQYMNREIEKIEKINRMIREKEKPGDYHP
jgi:hypothetical protein